MGLSRSARRPPEQQGSPAPSVVRHLLALPFAQQQGGCQPNHPACPFELSLWKQAGLEVLPPAPVEPSRKRLGAPRFGKALPLERGRGIQAGPPAPLQSNRRAGSDRPAI